MQSVKNLTYAWTPEQPLALDLYLPNDGAPKPYPLLVWIHGGAWRSGNRATGHPAEAACAWGYALASLSYRLTDVAIWPAQIHDCKAAIRWLRARAHLWQVDAQRIGVWGPSAGGHLASMLGTTASVPELEGALDAYGASSAVQAVCDWFGPTNFTEMSAFGGNMDHDAPDSPESILVGGPVQQREREVASANPITYVSESTPPFLIMHGTEDPLVPFNQSELLAKALRSSGVPVELVPLIGAGHGGPDFRTAENLARVRRFFDLHIASQRR